MRDSIAVIGATGFVGKALTASLRERGCRVLAYSSREVCGEVASEVEWHRWDATCEPLRLPGNVDGVFYLSQSPHYRDYANRPEDVLGVNSVGPAVAARAARDAGAGFFCFASTGSVYAPAFHPISEGHPVQRNDGYSVSKLAGEDAVALFDEQTMRVVSVRIFGVYGPGQTGKLVPNLRGALAAGKPITLAPGRDGMLDGGLRISLTHVRDLVRGLIGLWSSAVSGDIVPPLLNLASSEAVDIRGIAEAIGRIDGRRPRFESTDTPRAGNLVADVGLLQQHLDLEFTAFEQGICETLSTPVRSLA